MANTITIVNRQDGSKYRTFTVHILGDGSGEVTNAVIYDFSADTSIVPGENEAKSIRILEAKYDCSDSNTAFQVDIIYGGATPDKCWHIGIIAEDVCFRSTNGLANGAGVPNGNILISTTGLAAGNKGAIYLHILKG